LLREAEDAIIAQTCTRDDFFSHFTDLEAVKQVHWGTRSFNTKHMNQIEILSKACIELYKYNKSRYSRSSIYPEKNSDKLCEPYKKPLPEIMVLLHDDMPEQKTKRINQAEQFSFTTEWTLEFQLLLSKKGISYGNSVSRFFFGLIFYFWPSK
jgi:hypothetical protein